MTYQDHPDNYEEFRQLRDYRAWYEETAARRKEWEEREREADQPEPITLGAKVGLVFLVVASLLVVGGGVHWIFVNLISQLWSTL